MLITATNRPLRVDYKINGKFYNPSEASEGQPQTNSDTHSTFPFDSQELQPGESFNRTDAEVIRVVELGLGENAAPATGGQD